MQTLDPKFLYGGGTAARAAYAAWCSGSYAATRRNPAVELARRHLGGARAWLLLGAGPDPATEVECMSEADERAGLLGSGPALAVVHDVDAVAAEETRLLVAAEVGRSLSLRLETKATHGPLPTLCARDTEPLQETVATLLGYSYANLYAAARVALLANLRAHRLLLDLPLADYARDPRLDVGMQASGPPSLGGATVQPPEDQWLRAAVSGWAGQRPNVHASYTGPIVQRAYWLSQKVVGGGYTAQMIAPVVCADGSDLVLIQYTRKALHGWLEELTHSGVWQVDAVEVTRDAGHPLARAAVLLSRAG